MAFSYGDLLEDIGPWLLLGVVLAGMITVFISPRFIEAYLGEGLFSMLIMTALATPLYVCATASTPIAAALAVKGLSPGAALVFLLAGPATNVATLTMVSKLMGKRAAAIYLISIIACSLAMGMAVNALYRTLGLDITRWVHAGTQESHGVFAVSMAVILLLLIAKPMIVKLSRPKPAAPGNQQQSCSLTPEDKKPC